MRPTFRSMWDNYPTKSSPCDDKKKNGQLRYKNQCAIRMGITLEKVGVSLKQYKEPKCSHKHPRGAESLANWLWRNHLGRPKIFTSGATAKAELRGQTGLIFFKDCFTRAGDKVARGDHIDLWDKGRTKGFDDPGNRSKQVWFWKL